MKGARPLERDTQRERERKSRRKKKKYKDIKREVGAGLE